MSTKITPFTVFKHNLIKFCFRILTYAKLLLARMVAHVWIRWKSTLALAMLDLKAPITKQVLAKLRYNFIDIWYMYITVGYTDPCWITMCWCHSTFWCHVITKHDVVFFRVYLTYNRFEYIFEYAFRLSWLPFYRHLIIQWCLYNPSKVSHISHKMIEQYLCSTLT